MMLGDGIGVGVASAAGAPCPVIYFIVIVELGADAVDRTEAAVVGNILASCGRAGRGAGRGRYGGRRVQITALVPICSIASQCVSTSAYVALMNAVNVLQGRVKVEGKMYYTIGGIFLRESE